MNNNPSCVFVEEGRDNPLLCPNILMDWLATLRLLHLTILFFQFYSYPFQQHFCGPRQTIKG